MAYTIRKLSFAETWKEGLLLYSRNFPALIVIAVVSVIPALFFLGGNTLDALTMKDSTDLRAFFRVMAWFVFSIAIGATAAGVMVGLMYSKIKETYKGFFSYMREILPLVGIILMLSFVIAFAVMLGMMAFMLPGVYAALCFSLAVEIMAIEKTGIAESLKRSFNLTNGKKAEVLLYSLIFVFINLGLERGIAGLMSLSGNMEWGIDPRVISLLLSQILVAPLGAAVFMQIYFNYRVEKEPAADM